MMEEKPRRPFSPWPVYSLGILATVVAALMFINSLGNRDDIEAAGSLLTFALGCAALGLVLDQLRRVR